MMHLRARLPFKSFESIIGRWGFLRILQWGVFRLCKVRMTFMLSAQLLAFRRHKENSCEIRRCDASIIVLNAKEKFLSEKKMFVDNY